jgi:hypothetical protein
MTPVHGKENNVTQNFTYSIVMVHQERLNEMDEIQLAPKEPNVFPIRKYSIDQYKLYFPQYLKE